LEQITILSQQRYVSPVDFAVIYAGLDDAESTFKCLEAGYRDRATRIHELFFFVFRQLSRRPTFRESPKPNWPPSVQFEWIAFLLPHSCDAPLIMDGRKTRFAGIWLAQTSESWMAGIIGKLRWARF
jgi:hypothetical protein